MTERRSMPDHDSWPEYIVPWDDTTEGPVDMSYLLDKPAGATGFIRNVDGHFVTGDGKRWRMWGLNLCTDTPLPPMELAPVVARRLAKYAVNCIRLHAIDHRWPNGILMRSRDGKVQTWQSGPGKESTRALDPEGLARLDWFIYCCKNEGIYLDLNLNVARTFTEADGVIDAEVVRWGKGLTYFDERLIALQKEYARQLLDHVNPFTGVRYADEPAICLIEIVNENSLLEFWFRGYLTRGESEPYAGHWYDVPPYYVDTLDRLWNGWLARRYADRAALSAAWGGDLRDYEDAARGSVQRLHCDAFATANAQRFRDEALFYTEIERDFFLDMRDYLRGELGTKQLILGTSDHNQRWSAMPMLQANAVLDVMDGHMYWQHPQRPARRTPGRDEWTIVNTPMVDQPDASVAAALSRSKVQGLPYILSEVNEPFPNDYGAEFLPILAAYALLQDWDGIIFYDYDGTWSGPYWDREQWRDDSILTFFELSRDPVKWTQMASVGLMFLRGDVQAAREVVERRMPQDWVLESLREPGDREHPYWMPHLPGRLALVHRTEIASFHAEALEPAAGEVSLPEGAIRSDTGELTWAGAPEDGHVLIDAPRHQAVIGRAGRRATRNMVVDSATPFAVIELASLDGAPIASSDSMLLVAVARSANTGMRWTDDSRTSCRDDGGAWGHAPTRLEPVQATVTLRGLADARQVTLQPLDAYGQPQGEPLALERRDDGYVATLPAGPATPWFLLAVAR